MQITSNLGTAWSANDFTAPQPPAPTVADPIHEAPARSGSHSLSNLLLPPAIARQIELKQDRTGDPDHSSQGQGHEQAPNDQHTPRPPFTRVAEPDRLPSPEEWAQGSHVKGPLRVDRPLVATDGPVMTPLAQAAAEVAGTAPAAPAGPMADPVELAALELLLADPANREMVEHFGGQLEPLPTWTSVGQGIEARYGADLAARLNQLQTAQRAVDDKFFAAMDQAQQNPPAQPAPMPPRKGQSTPTSDQPGWLYDAGSGHADGGGPSWKFDPGAFARHYAQGDSPAQRAFAHLHGAEPLQFVPAPNTEAGGVDSWQLSGLTVRLGRPVDSEEGLTPEAFHAKDGWVQSGVLRPEHHLDPNRITKLNNKEFVWFDPVHGFSTDPKNLRGSWIDRAFPQIMGVAFGVIGAGVVGHLVSAAGTVAQGAAAGAAGSALNQFVSTGQVNFKQVLNSALAGGLTAGVTQLPGVGHYIDGAASTPLARLLEYTGKATLQGAIQSITGGQFKDGFVNSLMCSVAGEISAHINAQISQMPGLSASEQSALRLLGNATSTALRAVANSGDPLMGVAGDFLSQVMGDAVQQEMQHVPPPADPLGEFIAAHEEAWNDINKPVHSTGSPAVTAEGSGPGSGYRVEVSGTDWEPEGVLADGGTVWRPRADNDYVDPSARLVQGVPLEGPAPALLGYEPVSDRVIGGVREIEYRPQGESSWGQTLSDIASRTQGAFAGALSSFANMVIGTGQIALNSALQVGDLLTLGYNHDHPLIQQAWSEQQQLGESIVQAILHPRETATAAMESIASRYNAAMALTDPYAQSRALGELFNDVGQAAIGAGYTAASVVKPIAGLGRAVGENAFAGPRPGSAGAQFGGVNVGNSAGSTLNGELGRLAHEGHSIARHGAAVSDQQLLTRATTGYAPDGSAIFRNGQVVIPPSSTAFNSNALLVEADLAIRANYLDRAIALSPPGLQRITIEGVDMGSVVGRGYDRVDSIPGAVGPLQFYNNLSRVTAVYSYNAASGSWQTITIYPVK